MTYLGETIMKNNYLYIKLLSLLFVAIIFAAIGSSFPDTIISYKDAQKGNYDDRLFCFFVFKVIKVISDSTPSLKGGPQYPVPLFT